MVGVCIAKIISLSTRRTHSNVCAFQTDESSPFYHCYALQVFTYANRHFNLNIFRSCPSFNCHSIAVRIPDSTTSIGLGRLHSRLWAFEMRNEQVHLFRRRHTLVGISAHSLHKLSHLFLALHVFFADYLRVSMYGK